MKNLLAGELSSGAIGLSTGLEYDPGIYSGRDEVIELAELVAEHGKRYISHIRSEDRYLWDAIEEIIDIGRLTGIPVQISHLKIAIVSQWGKADSLLAILDAARDEGVKEKHDDERDGCRRSAIAQHEDYRKRQLHRCSCVRHQMGEPGRAQVVGVTAVPELANRPDVRQRTVALHHRDDGRKVMI